MKPPSRSEWNGPDRSRRLGRTLLASLFVTVLFFLLSAAVVNYRATGIVQAAESIADDALPSIQHLAAARTVLRRLEALRTNLTREASPERKPEGAWLSYKRFAGA